MNYKNARQRRKHPRRRGTNPKTRIRRQPLTEEQRHIKAIKKVYEACVAINILSKERKPLSLGSGIVYKVQDGNTYIVTNEHVIRKATFIQVAFINGDKQDATLLGSDALNDLAVLKLTDYEAQVVATFGHTEDLEIGQTIIAIGNPFHGAYLANTVTLGIVSGHRIFPFEIGIKTGLQDWEAFLQIDAPIGGGNSGGALINLQGEVVGINTWGIGKEGFAFMNFSIPSYIFLPVIEKLQQEDLTESS